MAEHFHHVVDDLLLHRLADQVLAALQHRLPQLLQQREQSLRLLILLHVAVKPDVQRLCVLENAQSQPEVEHAFCEINTNPTYL